MCIKNENVHYHVNTIVQWLQIEIQTIDIRDTDCWVRPNKNDSENVEAL